MTSFSELREGEEMTGTVESIVSFGTFVRIASDGHGLLHGDAAHEVGAEVRVRLIDVDLDRMRAGLELVEP